MVLSAPLSAAAASLLLLPSVLGASLYSKTSPVLKVDALSYESLIVKSNYTSILEFYAPWCGHCQNLKPAYEKAATALSGLAKVAGVNCDDDNNRPFCGSMGVKGFPTLKIVRPGALRADGKRGAPVIDEYRGARSAKAIVSVVSDMMPNHVAKLTDKNYQAWLEKGDGTKAILFTDKKTVSATLKAIAVDFLGSVSVAQIRDTEKEALEVFNIDEFPTFLILPSDGGEPVPYYDVMKKAPMVDFLTEFATPNPDPAPKKNNANKSSSSSDGSGSQDSEKPTSTFDVPLKTAHPTPKTAEIAQPIVSLPDGLSLQQECLNDKAGTCILALLPEEATASSATLQAVNSLSEIHHKHEQAKRKLFPFYQLPSSNSQAAALRSKLGLGSTIELIALNGKRSWYRHYPKTTYTQADIEAWIDAIRMGDTAKQKVPAGLIIDAADLPSEPVKLDTDNAEAMKEALRAQVPKGVDIELEEIDPAEYEKIAKQNEDAGKANGKAHDEL